MYFISILAKGQAHLHMITTKLLPAGQKYPIIASLKLNSIGSSAALGKSLLTDWLAERMSGVRAVEGCGVWA